MPKSTLYALAISLLVAFQSLDASAGDALELLQPGKLSCGADGGYPPFSFTSNTGEFDGLEVRSHERNGEASGA